MKQRAGLPYRAVKTPPPDKVVIMRPVKVKQWWSKKKKKKKKYRSIRIKSIISNIDYIIGLWG